MHGKNHVSNKFQRAVSTPRSRVSQARRKISFYCVIVPNYRNYFSPENILSEYKIYLKINFTPKSDGLHLIPFLNTRYSFYSRKSELFQQCTKITEAAISIDSTSNALALKEYDEL